MKKRYCVRENIRTKSFKYVFKSFLFLVLSGSDEFRKSSSKSENFESFEISKFLSTGLTGICLSDGAFIEGFLNIFLSNEFIEFARSDASTNLHNLLGKLKSSDGDGLTLDSFTIDEDALIGDDIDDCGEFAFLRSVVDSCDSSNLNETIVSLSY